MKICEIFYSIQGEGEWIGRPAIFIRTSGCNLKCRKATAGFDCDTQYHTQGKEIAVEKVLEKLKDFNCKNVVITGGEPTMQCELIELIEQLEVYDYAIQIETNGSTEWSEELKEKLDCCCVVCSPKFYKDKGWMFHRGNLDYVTSFKFVVKNINDVDNVLSGFGDVDPNDIYLMPEGANREDYIKNAKVVVELCKEHNFMFSPREHVVIWGTERGK